MQEIISAFGIDSKLIVVQIVNFSLLLGLLWYFLYTPLLKLLSDRQEKIQKGVEDAEKAAQSREDASTEKKAVLSEAHKEAEAIDARAKTHADEKAAGIIAEAQDKAVGVVANATAKGEELKVQARKESEAEIAKLAILAAEKVLQEKEA